MTSDKVKPGMILYFSLKKTEITPHTVFIHFIKAIESDRVIFHFYSINKEQIREIDDFSYTYNWDAIHYDSEEISPLEMRLTIKAVFEG